jgi:hypothetical protein
MSLADQAVLSTDATFTSRVKEALAQTCINIISEAVTISSLQLHLSRARLAAQILNNLNGGSVNWAQTFAITVATDSATISTATANSTVVLTTANVAAQAALVTDTEILNAVSAQFNAFLTLA